MKIGMITSSMSREAGGMFNSVRSLSSALRAHSTDVEIHAIRDKHSDQDLASWGSTDVKLHPPLVRAIAAPHRSLLLSFSQSSADIAHLNGLWSQCSIASLIWAKKGRPLVISPRGMLDPWALRNSAWKKRVAGALVENEALHRAVCIHALCEAELKAIRQFGIKAPVAVIPNGVTHPKLNELVLEPEWRQFVGRESKVLLFMSRLHKKKGVEELLHATKILKASKKLNGWKIVLAGWGEPSFEQNLLSLISHFELDDCVFLIGPQFGKEKFSTLSSADAFILPSYSEGLPMAVLEAWSFGLPTLITNECNLPLAFDRNAAIRIANDPASMALGLENFFNLEALEVMNIGENARSLARAEFDWLSIARRMRSVYEWILNSGPIPDSVDF